MEDLIDQYSKLNEEQKKLFIAFLLELKNEGTEQPYPSSHQATLDTEKERCHYQSAPHNPNP